MSIFKNLLIFIISFLLAFFIWSVVELFLPKTPPLVFIDNSKLHSVNINLIPVFFNTSNTKKPENPKNIQSLKGVTLKAIYNSKKNAFIIVEKNKKTYFINLNDKFLGYKLIRINPNSAIFEKNSKQYKLEFQKTKSINYTPIKNTQEIKPISRNTLNTYKNNFSKIWKEIGIVKTNEGYKITYIKPNSIFQKIGLKKGDIILEVNNIPLKTDADAWKAYNLVENANEVELLIKRNYNIKVLRYEIN
jgi:general secretion pathway protein C